MPGGWATFNPEGKFPGEKFGEVKPDPEDPDLAWVPSVRPSFVLTRGGQRPLQQSCKDLRGVVFPRSTGPRSFRQRRARQAAIRRLDKPALYLSLLPLSLSEERRKKRQRL